MLSNLISNARYSFILSASTSAGTGETEEIEFDFSKGKFLKISPANIFLFKISKKKKKKKNARKRCEICSELTKTPERHHGSPTTNVLGLRDATKWKLTPTMLQGNFSYLVTALAWLRNKCVFYRGETACW